MLFVHMLIGFGISFAYSLWCLAKKHERHLFVFEGPWFSFGTGPRWIEWYLAAYVFEFMTSFMASCNPTTGAGMFYWEVAMSFIQAVAFALGAFIVDRIFRLLEVHHTTV
jgi:hypothetical protein